MKHSKITRPKMISVRSIETLFDVIKNSIEVDENLREYSLQCNLSSLSLPDKELLIKYLQGFPPRDTVTLRVIVGNNPSVTLRSIPQIDSFFLDIEKEIKYREEESIQLKISVLKKNDNNVISVYELKKLVEFLTQLSLCDFLRLIINELGAAPGIHFQLYEECDSFGSRNIFFSKDSATTSFVAQKEITNKIKENCHFGNIDEFSLNPNYFYLISESKEFPEITVLFGKLTLLFSLISIFNITTLGSTGLSYRLVGYKVFEGLVNFEEIDLTSKDHYFNIFSWIYSEKNKITDKIGLARNILSISLKSDSININESVFISLQSGYQIYLKDNINRYIEIRNKINDQLLALSGSASQVINNYVDNFKKSLMAFLPFFVSVLIIRVLSNGNFEDVFTKDATILSLTFLFISLLFLLFSHWEFSKERIRLDENYANLKSRFTDLLVVEDITRILNNDKDYNTHMAFIERKRKSYTILWVLVLLVILFSIISMSTYINWFVLKDSINWLLSQFPVNF